MLETFEIQKKLSLENESLPAKEGSHFSLCRSGAATLSSFFLLFLAACSIVATRPVQQMSNTSAAIRAAKEVQGDVLAPELFQQASEVFFKARREYKFKNFQAAREFAEKSRRLAEQAEYEALRSGGSRSDAPTDPMVKEESRISSGESLSANPAPSPNPYPYPTPEGIPAEGYDQRLQEQKKDPAAAPSSVGGAAGLLPGQGPR